MTTLQHSPAHILAAYLRGLEPQTTPPTAWSIFVSHLPDQPANAVCVYDTEGRIDGRLQSTGDVCEHPGAQVLVRSTAFTPGWRKAVALKAILESVLRTAVTLDDGARYTLHAIQRRSGVLPIGQDPDTRLEMFTINVLLALEPLAIPMQSAPRVQRLVPHASARTS